MAHNMGHGMYRRIFKFCAGFCAGRQTVSPVLVQLGTVPTVLSQTNALPASEAARTRVRASHLPCSRAEPSEAHAHTACAYSIQPGYGTLGTRPWYQGTYAYNMAMGIFPTAIFYIGLGARTTILYARRDLPSN